MSEDVDVWGDRRCWECRRRWDDHAKAWVRRRGTTVRVYICPDRPGLPKRNPLD